MYKLLKYIFEFIILPGFSFSFYKSPKSVTSPYRRVEPLPMQSPRVHKSRKDGINKGVGHKIKKPKMKAKGKEQVLRVSFPIF